MPLIERIALPYKGTLKKLHTEEEEGKVAKKCFEIEKCLGINAHMHTCSTCSRIYM